MRNAARKPRQRSGYSVRRMPSSARRRCPRSTRCFTRSFIASARSIVTAGRNDSVNGSTWTMPMPVPLSSVSKAAGDGSCEYTVTMPSTRMFTKCATTSRSACGSPRVSSISPRNPRSRSKRCRMEIFLTSTGLSSSLKHTPIVPVRPPWRPRARVLGTKLSACAASSTRRRVSGLTAGCPLSARDTVQRESFKCSASCAVD